ncbi:uncharacterized protein Tco025E_10011, partial [Trypanosoma conorhini]
MAGRALLVCALCALCCAAAGAMAVEGHAPSGVTSGGGGATALEKAFPPRNETNHTVVHSPCPWVVGGAKGAGTCKQVNVTVRTFLPSKPGTAATSDAGVQGAQERPTAGASQGHDGGRVAAAQGNALGRQPGKPPMEQP